MAFFFKDALWHNSLTIALAVGQSPHDMFVEVTVGVPKLKMVDVARVGACLAHCQVTAKTVKGGLDGIDKERSGVSVIAMATVAIRLDVERHQGILVV